MIPEMTSEAMRARRIVNSGPVDTLVAELSFTFFGSSGVHDVGLSTSAALNGIVMFISPDALAFGASGADERVTGGFCIFVSADITIVESSTVESSIKVLSGRDGPAANVTHERMMLASSIYLALFIRVKLEYTDNLPYIFPLFQEKKTKNSVKLLAQFTKQFVISIF
jgi:hypothetical protein